MAKFTAQEIREKLLNRKRRMQKLTLSLPDLEELDGYLAIQELTAKDVDDAQNLSKVSKDETNDTIALGALIARSLVLYDTKERIFQDNEAQFIAENFGVRLLLPLGEAVKQFSGVSAEAMDDIRKNLVKTGENASATS